MSTESKISILFVLFFLIFPLSLIWQWNVPNKVKVTASFAIVLPVVLMVGTMVLVRRWTENITLTYIAGFLVFVCGHVMSEYITLGRVYVTSLIVGLLIGGLVIGLHVLEASGR